MATARRRVRVRVVRRGVSVYTAVTVKVTVIVLVGTNMYMCAYIYGCVGQYIHFCVCVCYLLMTSSTVVFRTEDVWPSASVIGV